jgi:hypothetical protein
MGPRRSPDAIAAELRLRNQQQYERWRRSMLLSVEPVFGQIKQARGFRQFLLRGKEKVKGEWALLCLTHNILRFHAAMQY